MDEIEIVPPDPLWPAAFADEAARLGAGLPGELLLEIEHFGSTAVAGLWAKPIIDILIAVPSVERARHLSVRPMEGLGYAFWAGNPRRDRLFFVRGLPPSAPRRTHHVHMTERGGEMWARLLFRAPLRTHPAEAARYGVLKQEWARQHRLDREAYGEAKSGYVAEIMAVARNAR